MFEEGSRMAEQYGRENVYDFSLGNPNVPAPPEVNTAMIDILQHEDPHKVHGYMPNAGFEETRAAVAENLNKRFGTDYHAGNVIMTVGAGSALNVILKTILDPGDEVIVLAPYFVEYRSYIGNYLGKTVEVMTDPGNDFLPNPEAIKRAITPRTRGIIINNPNNPTGVVYSEEVIRSLTAVLEEKQKEYGAVIYLISDEPYRELVYEGAKVPFLPDFYDNTLVGYSFSKSLSLPGERIGYVLVPDASDHSEEFLQAAVIANRISGDVNAPSLMQLALVRCLDAKVDVQYYERNGKDLYEGLTAAGFQCVKPQGAFYLWVKSPVSDEKEFVEAGKRHHILMVPGSSFAGPGYVRLSFCVSHEMILRSLPAFRELAKEFFK